VKSGIQIVTLVGLLGLVSGCGPVVSGVKILSASVRLSETETAGARETALYEFTMAEEYLKKAREEHAYSEFWYARRYVDKALLYAKEARSRAEVAARTEQMGTGAGE
jgi:hypothetical protein